MARIASLAVHGLPSVASYVYPDPISSTRSGTHSMPATRTGE